MTLTDELREITHLSFDTAPLIYFVERHPHYFDRMLFIMRYIDRGLITGVTSTLALAEVQVQPLRLGNDTLAKQYESVMTSSFGFRLDPVTAEIANRAAAVRARYHMSLPDALHLATAIISHSDAFLTNDKTLKRVSEIPILILDELTL